VLSLIASSGWTMTDAPSRRPLVTAVHAPSEAPNWTGTARARPFTIANTA
jgi:hypothetical protein